MADTTLRIAIDGSRARTDARALESDLDRLKRSGDGVDSSMAQLSRTLKTALGGFSAFQITKELIQAGTAADSLNQKFKTVFGTAEAGGRQLAFIRAESERLGLSVTEAANSFALLSAATVGTNLQGQKTRDIFSAISEASAKLSLTTEQTNGALTAIQQIISKGTVSAEELRGQLGERLPGAFQIAARAMGVTTAELGKLLEQGALASDDFLPKFAAELRKTFGSDANTRIESVTANFARLTTEIQLTAQAIGALANKSLSPVAGQLAEDLKLLRDDPGQAALQFAKIVGLQIQGNAVGVSQIEAQTRRFNEARDFTRANPFRPAIDPFGPSRSDFRVVQNDPGLTGIDLLTSGITPPKPGAVPRAVGSVGRSRQLPTPQQFGPTAAEAAQALAFAARLQADAENRVNGLARNAAFDLQEGPLAAGAAQRAARGARRARRGNIGITFGDIDAQTGAAVDSERARFKQQESALRGGSEDALRKDGLLKENETINDLIEKARQEHQARLTEIDADGQQARRDLTDQYVGASVQALGDIASAAESLGKRGFAAYKAAAIAQTIISTFQGAQNAFQSLASIPVVGPALGGAAAAAAIISGLARVNQIRSQQYGGGREFGGDVQRSRFYEIGEKGKPELVQSDGRYYLFGAQGNVIPANGSGGGGQPSGGNVSIVVNNTAGDVVNARARSSRGLNGDQVIELVVSELADNASPIARSVQSRTGRQAQGSI